MKEAVIIDAVRTPMGRSKGGMFRHRRSDDISTELVKGLLSRNPKVDPASFNDVIWGCVQQTKEQAFNLGRFIALHAGLPKEVPAQTVNRLCGSSMTALHTAVLSIKAGEGDTFLVGGTEHMGHVPMMHGLDFNPAGAKHYGKASAMMGITAELLARQHKISREEQDRFAVASHTNAARATETGGFAKEIIPIMGHDADGVPMSFAYDEVIRPETNMEALAKLPPAFDPARGTVTAGNSSAISDGASALIVMSLDRAKELGLTPIAKVLSMASVGIDPAIMGFGPVPATKAVLAKAKAKIENVDLFELNEAFAAQSLPVIKELGLWDSMHEKVNQNGGAIALGHPLGCSGARISTTLLHLMKARKKRLGVATMCIGFGQGVATLFESY